MHSQTVSTRPLLGEEGSGDEVSVLFQLHVPDFMLHIKLCRTKDWVQLF